MCVECDSEDPAQLEKGVITASKFLAANTDPDIEGAQESTKGIYGGLN